MQYYHEENLRFGIEQTLFPLRSKFQIVACRGVIRLVITSCLYCKRETSKPVLLSYLISQKANFASMKSHSPLLMLFTQVHHHFKLSERTKSNQASTKIYVALFTCLTAREIVHLETAGNLSTNMFLLGLRRFICSRSK